MSRRCHTCGFMHGSKQGEPRERDMSVIGDLWNLSVAGPFTTGSVQITNAELVTTASGIPDDVVGAESLLIFQREQV
jgi:hypothetical protein